MTRKKASNKGSLVKAYAENLSSDLFAKSWDAIKYVMKRKSGVYVLSKGGKPYYIGLAGSLRSRVRKHLKDHHRRKWDRFSVYCIGKKKYIKDVETILMRVAEPDGNKQKGGFGKKRNLKKKLESLIIQDMKNNLGA